MKRYILSLIVLVILSSKADAQSRLDYTWDAGIKKVELTADEQKEPALYLKDYQFLEYTYTAGGELAIYQTVHRHVKINSDDAIQDSTRFTSRCTMLKRLSL